MPAARYRDSAVEVLTLPPVQVAALEHQGDKAALELALSRFIAWRKAEGLHPRQHPTYTVIYPPAPRSEPQQPPGDVAKESAGTDGDLVTLPADSPPESSDRLDICVTIYGHLPENDLGLVEKVIAGGRYAVMRVQGDQAEIRTALDFLCGPWLKRAGETLRDAPVILQRIGVGSENPTQADVVDLQLPLA